MSKNVKVLNANTNDDIVKVAIELFAQVKNLEIITEIVKSKKAEILEYMKNQGLDELNLEGLGKIDRIVKAESLIVDSERLKSVYNDIYQDCVKVKKGSEYITTKKY